MFSNSFAFKPVIYFDLNFVKGVKTFFFFACGYLIIPVLFVEKSVLSAFNSFGPWSKIS
jgi:hypothetical protein